MATVFEYTDYRKFLRDHYSEQKKKHPWYSFSVMAKKAGLRSKSYIAEVMNGSKNLSMESLFQIAKAFNLRGKAFAYFEVLVDFNQATNPEQREHFFQKLMEFNTRSDTRQRLVDQYELYAKWYHNTIRELVTWFDFDENYPLLARTVKPAITPGQAQESVNLLLRLGLLSKKGSRYRQTSAHITTGDEVRDTAVAHFHAQNLMLASESIGRCPQSDREISCLVAGLSQESIQKVKAEIQQFRKKLIHLISDDTSKPVAVYHINFQMFPTSEKNA